MRNKKGILIKVTYLVELTEEEINDDDTIDKIISKVGIDQNLLIDDEEKIIEHESTSSLILEPKEMNCGRCANCGQWVTDKEKDNAIEGLCYGATVSDKLLCDECLPEDHRWAF